MPTLSQGNIFDAAKRTALTVVFGHIGFNVMSVCWRAFALGCSEEKPPYIFG